MALTVTAWCSILVAIAASLTYVFLRTPTIAISEYRGQWAVIAGASQGLGAAWADRLCREGVHVFLLARRSAALQDVAGTLRQYNTCLVDYHVHDLSAAEQTKAANDILSSQHVDGSPRSFALLVYVAAHTSPVGRFIDTPSVEIQYTTVDVNIRSVLAWTHTFLRHPPPPPPSDSPQPPKKGVVFMSSLVGGIGCGYVANYAATKAWTTTFARALQYELRDQQQVDVLACVAGATTTPTYLQLMGPHRDEMGESTPETVVSGCLAGLGNAAVVAPGWKNKLFQLLLWGILPSDMVIQLASDAMAPILRDRNTANPP